MTPKHRDIQRVLLTNQWLFCAINVVSADNYAGRNIPTRSISGEPSYIILQRNRNGTQVGETINCIDNN